MLIQRLVLVSVLCAASASWDHLHLFPECADVCARLQVAQNHFFAFNIWNVTCEDLICIVKTRWYSSMVIPSKLPENFMVKYDLHVTDIEDIDIETHPQIHFWISFLWRDENLRMCDCSGRGRRETPMDLQADLWLPDLYFRGQSFVGRVGFYSGYSRMLIHRTSDNKEGLLIFWGLKARAGVSCPVEESGIFPFDRKFCLFRPTSLNPSDRSIIWKKNQISHDKLELDGMKVTIRKLCREEAECLAESEYSEDKCRDLDGFKLFIEREGHKMNEYFRYLTLMPTMLALFILLLPTNPPRHHGVDRYEAMLEVILQIVIIHFKINRMSSGFLFIKMGDDSYRLVTTVWIFMNAIVLTKRLHFIPFLLAHCYAWLLPSYPYMRTKEALESDAHGSVKTVNLVTYDAVKEGVRLMRACQAFIFHLKPTNKIIFAYLFISYYLGDHWFWALWRESSMLGASGGGSELVSPNCTCDCDGNVPPLIPIEYA